MLVTVPFMFTHYDCKLNIPSKIKFKLGMFQKIKLNKMLKGHYLTRIVALQDRLIIPLTRLHEPTPSGVLSIMGRLSHTCATAPQSPTPSRVVAFETYPIEKQTTTDNNSAIIESDNNTPLLVSHAEHITNHRMHNTESASHNPNLIYPCITTHGFT